MAAIVGPEIKGLEAAAPDPSLPDDSKHMEQVAGTLLEGAVRQFGPEIIDTLKAMLIGPGPEVGVGMNTPPPVNLPPGPQGPV